MFWAQLGEVLDKDSQGDFSTWEVFFLFLFCFDKPCVFWEIIGPLLKGQCRLKPHCCRRWNGLMALVSQIHTENNPAWSSLAETLLKSLGTLWESPGEPHCPSWVAQSRHWLLSLEPQILSLLRGAILPSTPWGTFRMHRNRLGIALP